MVEGGIVCQRHGLERKKTRDRPGCNDDRKTKTRCKTAKLTQRLSSNEVSCVNKNRRAATKGKAVSVGTGSGNWKDGTKTKGKLPLSGKVVYLDIKDSRTASSLEMKLKKLGAVIETFLSKSINYVISATAPSKSESQARVQGEGLGPDSPSFSNSPSPFNNPSPTYVGGKIIPVTRGRAMAQIACSRNRSPSPSSAVASALKLGIKVISIEGAEKWVHKELEKLGHTIKNHTTEAQSSPKGKSSSFVRYKRLQQTYIKVESISRLYRPLFSEMAAWPRINVDTPATTCPFDGKGVAYVQRSGHGDKDGMASIGHYPSPCTQSATHRRSVEGEDSSKLVGCPILTAGDLRREREKRRKEQRRRGYCECCNVKYNDIDKHVQEQSHREFARDKSNYDDLDTLIRGCPSTSQFLRSILLRHCTQKAASRPSASTSSRAEMEDDNSTDQVITLECNTLHELYQSPTDGQFTVAVPPSLNILPGIAGQMTPTHTPQYTIQSANSPARKKRRGQGHQPNQNMQVDGCDYEDKDPDGCLSCAKEDARDGPAATLLPAVVIRRPGAKGVYGSPRMKWGQGPSYNQTESECTPKKMRERSLIFGNSSIASLRCAPEELASSFGSVNADSSTVARQRKDSSLSAEIHEKNMLQVEGGKKRQLSCDNSYVSASSRTPRASTSQNREPHIDNAEDEKMILLNQSPGKKYAQEALQKNGRKSRDCTSRKAKAASDGLSDVSARVLSSRISPEVEKVLETEDTDIRKTGMKENPDKSLVHRNKTDTNQLDSAPLLDSDRIGKQSPDLKPKQTVMDKCKNRRAGEKKSTEHAHVVEEKELGELGPTQTSPVNNKKTPPLSSKDMSPPVTHHSPRKRHPISSTPTHSSFLSSAAQTPPKSYMQHVLEEEMGSSPIYSRTAVHSSTPIILTTRKLRHVDDAISQNVDAVCELLELDKPLGGKRSRRSILCEDAQAKSLDASVSAPVDEKNIHLATVEKKKKKVVRRHSSRTSPKADFTLLSSQIVCQERELKSSGLSTVSLSPEETVLGETGKPERRKRKYPDTHAKRVRPQRSVTQRPVKKVKLSNSWLLLSDNSMSRLLQSDSDHSTFKGFQGNEALSSGYSYEYKSEVEVTDDEEREWVIDQAKQEVEGEESDLGNFIPLFSSPGKKSDSSWEDACDQYLSFTVQHRLQGEQRPTRSPFKAFASTTPKKRKRSNSQQKSADTDASKSNPSKKRCSSRKRTANDRPIAGGLAAQPGMLTPTKQLCRAQIEQSSRDGKLQSFAKQSEEVVNVDEEVLFNYASPQKDNPTFSPLRALNSNIAVSSPSPRTRSRSSVGPAKLPQPFSLD